MATELINQPLYNDANLIQYLRFEDNVNDSKNSYNMTNYNVAYATGRFGKGGVFNGSTTYLYRSSLVTLTNFTCMLWVKFTSTSTMYIFGLNRQSGSMENQANFRLAGGKISFWDYSSGYGFQGYSLDTFNDGEWHHIAFAKSGTTGNFYLDGVANGNIISTKNVTYTNQYYCMGKNYRDNNYYLNATIDDYAIFNRTLTPAEIYSYYTYGDYRKSLVFPRRNRFLLPVSNPWKVE